MNELNIERCAKALAGAQAGLAKAERDVVRLSAECGELGGRLEDARVRHANALAALRAGDLAEDIAAARMAVAQADSADLQQMIAALQPRLDQGVRARDHALEHVQRASIELERAETAIVAASLDERIKQLEATLCAAVAERYSIGVSLAPGRWLQLSTVWRPSDELRNAVQNQMPPKR